MLRRRKPSINLPKNMEKERRIGVFMMMIGMTRMIFFVKSKPIGKQKQLGIGGRKYLSDFVYSLPSVRNPTSLFHILLQSDAIYLPQILSLIELPYYPLELRSEIWPNGIDADEIKVGSNANEVDKF
jgi:hypothetical protein